MRSSVAAAILWRRYPERLRPQHQGSRKLKNLRVLVVVRCLPNGHELAYVYRLPSDLVEKCKAQGDPVGQLLFVSTDTETFEPGVCFTGDRDLGDLVDAKQRRDRVLDRDSWGLPPLRVRVTSTRAWTPLIDLLDNEPDNDAAHAALDTRCRCGQRPTIDRHELMSLASFSVVDGKTRRMSR